MQVIEHDRSRETLQRVELVIDLNNLTFAGIYHQNMVSSKTQYKLSVLPLRLVG